jgi:Fe-S cluster assembly ATP-binding protein
MTELQNELIIRDLYVKVENREILKGLNLRVEPGKVHAIMGPNGSGKSTLAYALMGHPNYEVTQGEVLVNGQNVLDLPPNVRAKVGLFLAFQYPHSIPGVTMANFLRTAVNSTHEKPMPPREFRQKLREKMTLLKMNDEFAGRYVNEGFSGGEKKRAEILQMAMLEPKYAVLDETDSGLDIDALRIVADGVNALLGPHMGVLVITHYQRLLNYIKPDFVHVLVNGRIVREGGSELALELEKSGYDEYLIDENAVELAATSV